MGCLCPNKNRTPKNNLNEKLNEEPETIKTEDLESHITIGLAEKDNNDLSQKRKLAEYLLDRDINMLKKYLPKLRKLNNDDFRKLFEGDAKYFKDKNEKELMQLAQKFEDNKDLLDNFLYDEQYYPFISEIWRQNILQILKEKNNPNERDEILRKYKINTKAWDVNFQVQFNGIINIYPIKILGERMGNYLRADYGKFDELIKTSQKCKNTVEKKDKSYCNKVLRENLGISISKVINTFIPKFLSQKDTILKDIKNKEERKVIQSLIDSGLSEENTKKLRKKIEEIYAENSKGEITELFEISEEFEKIKQISEDFNNEHDFEFSIEGESINIGEKFDLKGAANFDDKAEAIFNNEAIKDVVLGLSLANVTYSVMHLSNTLMNYNYFSDEFENRLKEIRTKFERHQNEMEIISEDIDEAIEQILGYGKKFQQDLDEVEELIKDINDAMRGIKTERNFSFLNLVGSAGGIIISIIGAKYTKGDTQVDYVKGSIANLIAAASNITDIVAQQKMINDFNEKLIKAKTLEKEITDKIDELRKKFNELSTKHYIK